jgi:hypothetical protein
MPMLHQPETRAFDTIENVLFALRAIPERDHPLSCLIEAIEDDRARLLALALGSHLSGRMPPRISTVPRPGPAAGGPAI